MPLYMLDTNVLSDIVDDPFSRAAVKLRTAPRGSTCTSIVCAAELRFGAVKKGATKLSRRIAELLDGVGVAPLEAPADTVYADLRAHLERAGTPIGANDMLIAAHALALGATLVTANAREFSRVPGLAVEDWRA
jgi:tRNA(fMet)-specific endonuclease VapC